MRERGAGLGSPTAAGMFDASSRTPEHLRRFEATIEWLDLERLAPWVLGLAVLASGLLLYHLTQGSSFWGDDWVWITTRRANTIGTFLAPYDGHLSALPVVIYRLMFAVFGIDSYAPYRALVIGLSLVVGLLCFEYARPRIGRFPGMLAAALVLFIGPGWQDTMWAFQIGWVLALGFGIAALIMLDRRTRAADIAACALTFASICSTSFGIAFALGIAFDVAFTRRRWRDAWIPAIPLGLYAIWALHYHPTGINWSEITLVPTNLVQTFAGGAAGIVGLSGVTSLDPIGTNLTFGAPLVVLLAVWAVRCAMTGRFSVRAGALILILIMFSMLTTLGRAFETPLVSRYIYPDCVLVALLATDLASGRRFSRPVATGLAVLALMSVIANVNILRSGGSYLQTVGASTNADVAALDLGRGQIPPGYIASHLPDYPFVSISAGAYFAAERVLGTPAYTLAELTQAPAGARTTADQELISEQAIVLSPGVSQLANGGQAPAVVQVTGSVVHHGPCLRVTPTAATATGAGDGLVVTVAPGAVRITTGNGPATASARRFGPAATTLGTIGPDRSTIVLVRKDAAPVPWQLVLSGGEALQVCTLS